MATYIIAPLPNWICSQCGNPDDFIESSGNALVDFGRFMTGFLVFMGIGMFARPFSPLQREDSTLVNFITFLEVYYII